MNPFDYNKDFDPSNSEHFSAWVKMRPDHIFEGDWLFQLGRLKLLLLSSSVKDELDRSMIMLGWKSENGLL